MNRIPTVTHNLSLLDITQLDLEQTIHVDRLTQPPPRLQPHPSAIPVTHATVPQVNPVAGHSVSLAPNEIGLALQISAPLPHRHAGAIDTPECVTPETHTVAHLTLNLDGLTPEERRCAWQARIRCKHVTRTSTCVTALMLMATVGLASAGLAGAGPLNMYTDCGKLSPSPSHPAAPADPLDTHCQSSNSMRALCAVLVFFLPLFALCCWTEALRQSRHLKQARARLRSGDFYPTEALLANAATTQGSASHGALVSLTPDWNPRQRRLGDTWSGGGHAMDGGGGMGGDGGGGS